MFCTKCGKETRVGASFCTHCGNPLTQKASTLTGQFLLLPNETLMLSFTDAWLEQKETFLGTLTRGAAREAQMNRFQYANAGASRDNAWRATYKGPNLNKIFAESLLVTDKRLIFVQKGQSIHEIIIDREYASEVLHARGEVNQKAEAQYWAALMSQPRKIRIGRPKIQIENFGFITDHLFLLKSFQRKEGLVFGPELKLDVCDFGGYSHQILKAPDELNSKTPDILKSVTDGHLKFKEIGQLGDKLVGFLEPKMAAMSGYFESQQYANDYYGSSDYEKWKANALKK